MMFSSLSVRFVRLSCGALLNVSGVAHVKVLIALLDDGCVCTVGPKRRGESLMCLCREKLHRKFEGLKNIGNI